MKILKCEYGVFEHPPAPFYSRALGDTQSTIRPENGIPLEDYLKQFPFSNPHSERVWIYNGIKSGRIRIIEAEWTV